MKSFRYRLFVKFVPPVFLLITTWNLFLGWYFANYQKKLLEKELLSIAQTLAAMIEMDGVSADLDTYKEIEMNIRQVMSKNTSIVSVHILGLEGKVLRVLKGVHSDADDGPILSDGSSCSVDDFPGALMGFAVPLVFKETKFFTCYMPLRDKIGNSVALLRLKYGVNNNLRLIYLQIFGMSFLFFIIFVSLIFFVSHQISIPLQNLLIGIENIQKGNLDYTLQQTADYEFNQIALAFNKMAKSLRMSRKVIQDYLYRTIRSMVTIIEEKDSYTKGHSERVAFYAEKIAKKMGLPEKRIQLLKDIALLHDIGKLGIDEKILNKAGPLTEDEWKLIRRHPLSGREIVRPIFFEKDGLDIISQHHERFDGTGYPYSMKGNEINILAQILSVADAFDAMTSARAYRKPLSKSEAIRQLKENSGSQFNPEIVNVFLKILEEEKHEILRG
ncbi:MAG: HD domain-containing protein [Candidatus Omnitrophica bacterium]|nr:HD domain-containing protein [Candidatus Omnitrophota bacterium]